MAGATGGSRPHTGEKSDAERIFAAWERLRKQYRTEARGVRLELTSKEIEGNVLGRYESGTLERAPTIRVSLPALQKAIQRGKDYPMKPGGKYYRKGLVNLANAVVRHELAHRREEMAEWRTGKSDVPLPPLKPGIEGEGRRYGGEPPHGALWNRMNVMLQGAGAEPKFSNIGLPREFRLPVLRSSWREG